MMKGRGQRFSAAERVAFIHSFQASGETLESFSSRHGISLATLCKWRKRYLASGAAGLVKMALIDLRNLPTLLILGDNDGDFESLVSFFRKTSKGQGESDLASGARVCSLDGVSVLCKNTGGLAARQSGVAQGLCRLDQL